MALNANALTSLAFAKTYLKIPALETTLDSIVEFWINVASQRIETETRRKLKAQATIEFQDGRNNNIIVLREYPANSITSLTIDSDGVFTDPSDIIDPASYRITDSGNSLLLIDQLFPRGYCNIKVVYNAGYASVPSDLENAALWFVSYYHKMRDAGDIGRTAKGKGDESVTILQDAPKDIMDTINLYRRIEIASTSSPIYNV
jgi:uncharacterized phiE125 gp8 family phage protein